MEQLSPEKALEILCENGMYVSLEEANRILEFLRILADIAVNQIFEYESSRFIHPGEHGRAG
jgi:hypothetical protein